MFYTDSTKGMPHVERSFTRVSVSIVRTIDGKLETELLKEHRTNDIKRVVRTYAKRFGCRFAMTRRGFVLKPDNGESWRILVEPGLSPSPTMAEEEEIKAHKEFLAGCR